MFCSRVLFIRELPGGEAGWLLPRYERSDDWRSGFRHICGSHRVELDLSLTTDRNQDIYHYSELAHDGYNVRLTEFPNNLVV